MHKCDSPEFQIPTKSQNPTFQNFIVCQNDKIQHFRNSDVCQNRKVWITRISDVGQIAISQNPEIQIPRTICDLEKMLGALQHARMDPSRRCIMTGNNVCTTQNLKNNMEEPRKSYNTDHPPPPGGHYVNAFFVFAFVLIGHELGSMWYHDFRELA